MTHAGAQKPPRRNQDITTGQAVAAGKVGFAVRVVAVEATAHHNCIPTEQVFDVAVYERLTAEVVFASCDCSAHEKARRNITALGSSAKGCQQGLLVCGGPHSGE